MKFKDDFTWGVAAASYQIEGAAYEDGKGLSIWDMFCKTQGNVWEKNTGDIACDHYHKFKEDIAIMKELGVKAYRLSLSWPRIMPKGIGEVNEKGIEFYNELIDELIANDIEPYVTIFHWDYPYELYKKGHWLNTDSSAWFEDYTKVVVDRFSDRVKNWFTLNEPQCFIGLGYGQGEHAPGLKLSEYDLILMAHNTLLAHGKAVKIIRENSKVPAKIGYAPVGVVAIPNSDKEEDVKAAEMAMFNMDEHTPVGNIFWSNSLWNDPVFLGKYPDEIIRRYKAYLPDTLEEDLKIISGELDYFGCNIYNGREFEMKNSVPVPAKRPDGYAITAFEWPITPKSLYWGPRFFYERYKKPVMITENGLSSRDVISLDGKVHDANRIDFLNRYLLELRKVSKEIPVEAYFQWSIMDNFEWAHGYKHRFGLVYVDYTTQERTIKDSAYWYKTVIESNGENLD